MRLASALAVVAACSGGGSGTSIDANEPSDTVVSVDAYVTVDDDGDGLADDVELQLARDYVPYLSLDPADGCPLSGLVARVRKHPADPTKILIVYSHLFERDCGLGGHVGDNEAFGIAIDPALPAPAGILAIKTASHQGTPCERISECSTCATDARDRCDIASGWPVLYASKGKHGQYATKDRCSLLGTCFDQCTLAAARTTPPIVNVGEPDHPLVTDLTAQGFITPELGWTEADLMNFDPWSAEDFGGAGNIAGDLEDPTFEPAPCL
ncbi:MAG: hypothetical protein HOV81_26150 [Kofleriaceae bacterium]|nr:hypothetical protein [Kofleriaceae bacterium]